MKDFFEDNAEDIIYAFTIIFCIFMVCLFITVPCLISEKRNIEKEITLKEIEVYGERINKDE